MNQATCIRDALRRYEREVARTNETARKVTRDAWEALDGGIINSEVYERIAEMCETYRQSMFWLLRDIYDVKESE